VGAFLLIWQPDPLKKYVLEKGIHHATKDSAFEITTGSVSGNLFKVLTVHEVKVVSRLTHQGVLQIPEIILQISWKSLLNKHLEFQSLRVVLDHGWIALRGWVAPGMNAGLAASFEVQRPGGSMKSLGKASLQLAGGRGPFQARATMAGGLSQINASLDLSRKEALGRWRLNIPEIHRFAPGMPILKSAFGLVEGGGRFQYRESAVTITGKGSAQRIAWQNQHIQDVQFDFSASTQTVTSAQILVSGWRSHPMESPWDIQTARLDIKRSGRIQLTGQFRNSTAIRTSGILKTRPDTQLRIKEMDVRLPGDSASWQLVSPGTRIISTPMAWVIDNLKLQRASEWIALSHGRWGKKDYRFQASVATHLDPAWLNTFSPQGIAGGGLVRSSLAIQGRWPDIAVTGPIHMNIPAVQKPSAGIDLRDIQVEIECRGNQIRVERMIARQGKKGQIEMTGVAQLPHLDFQVVTRNFTTQLKDIGVKARADILLHLGGRIDAPDVTGQVVLKKSVYDAAEQQKAKKNKKSPEPVSEGSQARSSKQSPVLWKQTAVDISARWDRDVWYRDGVTGIETRGDLRIQKPRGHTDLVLQGQIVSVRGTYTYFGKEFVIESAQIQFTGQPGMNPMMNVLASYQSDPTLVYLDITGTLKQPNLKLRSNPPLPDQDVVSVLVFGRPISELTTSGTSGTASQEMASLAGSVLGSYVTKGLRETGLKGLDLDVLDVQATPQGENRLTVGRYLTRNLFVSYGQTMSETGGKGLAADYYVGPHWVLEGSAGTADMSHVDVLFRYPLNGQQSGLVGVTPRATPFRNTLERPDASATGLSTTP
jgi:autotransporter translocation and assembly factor TamB